jgi:radical SAM superfamily enzyme YgiQ (UPF0313 family)
MPAPPLILLINPWITDFAAHDLWAKPMGLLMLASLLREGGCRVSFVDCLDRHDPLTQAHPDVLPSRNLKYGTGKYPRMRLEKPRAYDEIPRYYYRHGIHPDSFRSRLQSLPRPDLIWVTSMMTHWYPGVQQTVAVAREMFPRAPVWLGGIYAQLCPEHARQYSGADAIITQPVTSLPRLLYEATGFRPHNPAQWCSFPCHPAPALDLLPELRFAPILTSRGCPFHCPYCASGILYPGWERRTADAIYSEILRWHQAAGISDFAFYDDALLLQAETTLKPALQQLVRNAIRVRFHTPNAIHIRALTPEWCRLLYESGFTTLRLGLETTRPDRHEEWGGKVEMDMFHSALAHLRDAGFSGSQIGVYLLCGLPGQSPEEVAAAIRMVRDAGAQPHLAEYSPLPGTPLWTKALAESSFDLRNEPLYHNNTFFACQREDFTYEDLLHLKELARQARL